MAAKKKAKKRAPKRKSAPQVSNPMAKKPGRPPKKRAVIDAILAENKNLDAKDVQQKAKDQNVKISVQSVYNNPTWKSHHAKGASGRRRKSPTGKGASRTTSASASNGVQSEFTRCVKKLGVAKARELLDVIATYENA